MWVRQKAYKHRHFNFSEPATRDKKISRPTPVNFYTYIYIFFNYYDLLDIYIYIYIVILKKIHRERGGGFGKEKISSSSGFTKIFSENQ